MNQMSNHERAIISGKNKRIEQLKKDRDALATALEQSKNKCVQHKNALDRVIIQRDNAGGAYIKLQAERDALVRLVKEMSPHIFIPPGGSTNDTNIPAIRIFNAKGRLSEATRKEIEKG